jgi:hypothetical protein
LWAFKVKPDLSAGDDTIQWQLKRSVPNKPVPVVRGDLIFMVSDGVQERKAREGDCLLQ